jgi:hypothetical protein
MPGRRVMTIHDGKGPVIICVERGYADSFTSTMSAQGINVKPAVNNREIAGECFSIDSEVPMAKIEAACRIWQSRLMAE